MAKNNLDWKSQLSNVKNEMVQNMSNQEQMKYNREEQERKKRANARKREYLKIQKKLYDFLAGYKQNSGIFINNFFRNRDYKTYCQDKFHDFDFDVSGIFPVNLFDDISISMSMVRYLRMLEEKEIAYHPITPNFITHLNAVSNAFDFLKPLEEDTILYRGCTTLERNGVYGIVSTTTNKDIAEQFSRGTILTIHAPKGTKCIDIKNIRPKEQRKKDYENEILLPPCDYKILNVRESKKGREPNNYIGMTKHMEIEITQLDLLNEFLKRMQNPPEEYLPISIFQDGDYEKALNDLKSYIYQRENNLELKRLRNK